MLYDNKFKGSMPMEVCDLTTDEDLVYSTRALIVPGISSASAVQSAFEKEREGNETL